jgi:hypothetical protein
MKHTIEDALELLGGIAHRSVNIRIDINEQSLVKSLAKQVSRQIALTDRQLDLSLKKIEKYRVGLTQNNVDVDSLLIEKSLRFPLREIDRTQSITLVADSDNKFKIRVKFVFSKKFDQIWQGVQSRLIGSVVDQKNYKELSFNELDLHSIVSELRPLEFDVQQDVLDIYENIQEILENPSLHTPHVGFVDNKVEIKNANKHCLEYLESQYSVYKDSDLLVFLERVKTCGIYHKHPEIIKKITEESASDLVKNIVANNSTRFRINPEKYGVDTIFETIHRLKQWPLLIIVEDKKDTIPTVKSMIELLEKYIPRNEINVFFRLENDDQASKDFNQYVKTHGLNNFINADTKVVFITKNRIPKPLFNADWKPHTALVACSYEYGKTAAYIGGFSSVYYYNNNLNTRYSRSKGKQSIVEL